MNTQTFAQDQNITAITDEELMAVNGGGLGSVAKIIFKGTRNALAYEAATNIVGDAING